MRSMPSKTQSLMSDAMRQKLREKIRGQAVAKATKVHFPPFTVPEGMTGFVPTEKGWYELDILFYQITEKFHPSELPAGMYWYVRPFDVHVRLGASGRDILCPRSVHQQCAFCNELDKIRAKYGWKHPLPRGLRPTPFGAYYAIDPGSDQPVILAWNMSKFGELLEKELAQSELDVVDFAQPVGGRRVKFRIGEDTFDGHKYLTCDKIEFEERDDLDEGLLETAPDLDACLQPLDQDTINELFTSLFQEGTEAEDPEEAQQPEPDVEPRRVIGRPIGASTQSAGSRRARAATKPVVEEEMEESKTEVEVEDDIPFEEESSVEDGWEAEAEAVEIPEGCVECVACGGTGQSSRGTPCIPCQGNGFLRKKKAPPEPKATAGKATRAAGRAASPAAKPAGKAEAEAEADDWGDDWGADG